MNPNPETANTGRTALTIEEIVTAILDIERAYGIDAKLIKTNIVDVSYRNDSVRRIVFEVSS